MAKLERTVDHWQMDCLMQQLEEKILSNSLSANLEAGSDFEDGEPGAVSGCLSDTA